LHREADGAAFSGGKELTQQIGARLRKHNNASAGRLTPICCVAAGAGNEDGFGCQGGAASGFGVIVASFPMPSYASWAGGRHERNCRSSCSGIQTLSRLASGYQVNAVFPYHP